MSGPRRRRTESRRGVAAVELAVLLPFLVFLAVIAADWARLMYYTMAIENCARSGALYASDAESQSRSPYTSVHDAALAEAPSLSSDSSVSNLTVSQSTLTNGGDGSPAVVVTVSMTFKSITSFSYGSRFGVPNNETISRTVQMRTSPLVAN
jgi:Flp pilus assembly protein TadG